MAKTRIQAAAGIFLFISLHRKILKFKSTLVFLYSVAQTQNSMSEKMNFLFSGTFIEDFRERTIRFNASKAIDDARLTSKKTELYVLRTTLLPILRIEIAARSLKNSGF